MNSISDTEENDRRKFAEESPERLKWPLRYDASQVTLCFRNIWLRKLPDEHQ